jgi:hypothetical protein
MTTKLTTGRNDPCHCESGAKYKKCCLQKDVATRTKRRFQDSPAKPLSPEIATNLVYWMGLAAASGRIAG